MVKGIINLKTGKSQLLEETKVESGAEFIVKVSRSIGVTLCIKKNHRTRSDGTKVTYICKPTWVAQIKLNKKHKVLGYFKIEEDAARAYDKEAKLHYGEFASLNFKDS